MTRDAQHPLHGREGNELFATAIDAFYERLDAFLGTLLERLDSQTLLLVVSDHGFSTFRRAIHLNSWLRDQGYLVLRDGPVGLPFFENVDWQRTRAYALGFSGMYINRAGREAKGCVAEHAVQPLLDEITQKLRTLTDSKNGEAVLRSVTPSRDLYVGEHAGNAPDLVLGYREGYRTSWQTTIGSAPEKLIEDNTKKWSGDHLVDPSIVPGAFLCNRKLAASSPTVYDLAPTILGSFHIAQPSSMDGKNLFSNA